MEQQQHHDDALQPRSANATGGKLLLQDMVFLPSWTIAFAARQMVTGVEQLAQRVMPAAVEPLTRLKQALLHYERWAPWGAARGSDHQDMAHDEAEEPDAQAEASVCGMESERADSLLEPHREARSESPRQADYDDWAEGWRAKVRNESSNPGRGHLHNGIGLALALSCLLG